VYDAVSRMIDSTRFLKYLSLFALLAFVGIEKHADAQADVQMALPVPRMLDSMPPVAVAGIVMTTSGSDPAAPLTPMLAVTDLRLYDGQLATLFPRSVAKYPADSLRELKRARAQAWLDRLRAVPPRRIVGQQLLALAEVAWRAGDDTLARRYIDMRLAQLPAGRSGVIPRSLVLAAAVDQFATVIDDTVRMRRNISMAEQYARQLAALPAAGYATMTDSTDVLYRQRGAFLTLVHAADEMHATPLVLAFADRLLGVIARLELSERRGAVGDAFPYLEVATALVASPKGRAGVDSLDARLVAFLTPTSSDVTAPRDSARRAMQIRAWSQQLADRAAQFALLGRPAPEIIAHAWLNTSDSSYADTPRTHALNDGRVRVVAFVNRETLMLPMLERVQTHFHDRVECVLVTETEGHIGPDIATQAKEVAWLDAYYRQKRHLTMPIAIWAGARVAGLYGTSEPASSPVGPQYHAGWLIGVYLLDANGVVRGYQRLSTREHEARLIRRLTVLLDEAPAVGHTVARP